MNLNYKISGFADLTDGTSTPILKGERSMIMVDCGMGVEKYTIRLRKNKASIMVVYGFMYKFYGTVKNLNFQGRGGSTRMKGINNQLWCFKINN